MDTETVRVEWTQQEIYACLKYGTARRTGPLAVWIETGCLALAAIYCLVAFVAQPQTASLLLALAAAALIALLWIVPEKRFRSQARLAVQERSAVTVTVCEQGLRFNDETDVRPYGQIDCLRLPDMRILRFPGQLVGLPDRAFSADVLTFWEKALPGVPARQSKRGAGKAHGA